MDARNGSTELWPGSHHDTTYSIHQGSARVSEEHLEARRVLRAPLQPSVQAGDILMRDIRLWHAGMPNQTSEPRPMIAMIHWASWWAENDRIRFGCEVEEWLQHPVLRTLAEFVESEVEYLQHNRSYDLDK
jgi:ectoine hydroxylase-related dioxygenase (phytanoyl-CoA dioxygenase family)